MTASILPLRLDAPAYSFRVNLSDVEYLIDIRWNERDGAYYLGFFDSTESPIVQGVKVVLGMPLLRKVADERRPPGDIIAIDTTDSGTEAGYQELGPDGSRVILVYDDTQPS